MDSHYIFVVLLLTFTAQVFAHGYVSNVAIDGTNYEGNVPNQTPSMPQTLLTHASATNKMLQATAQYA